MRADDKNRKFSGLSKVQLKALKRILPLDALLLTPQEKLIYGSDAGGRFAMPWAVVRPQTVDQVQRIMHWAEQERIPIIPRARATNVVSACVPHMGGIVMSCLKMNRILSVDQRDFTAHVQPGVITYELQQAVRAKNLFYPPDPASLRVCTIGGNISTNAGGMHAVKYGVTGDYVLGLEVVLPGGELIRTGGRVHKNVVGYDLTSLLVGAEGTLGVIVGAWLKLLPLPSFSATILACFAEEAQAIAAVDKIFAAGMLPAAFEFMPAEVLSCLSGYTKMPWPESAGAALIIQVDGTEAKVEQDISFVSSQLAHALHLENARQNEQEHIWELRRLINPASFRLGPDKCSDDVCVPRSRILEAVEGIRGIACEYSLPVLVFGHVGDGNLHVNFMYDGSIKGMKNQVSRCRRETLRLVLELDGSISGEHGVGLSKKPFLTSQPGPGVLRLMRGIKKVFDPHNILNPGML